MDLVIIGTGCALGWALNSQGKRIRNSDPNVMVSSSKIPSGPLIYDSNRVQEVDEYVRGLAAKKVAGRVALMFPDDHRKPLPEIVGTDGIGDNTYPAEFSSTISDSMTNYFKNVQNSTNSETMSYDLSTGRPIPIKTKAGRVTSNAFKQTPQTFQSQGPLSLLSGLPLEMTHNNMQPMFGSTRKQTSAHNENALVLLEKYTGVPSVENQGTYSSRKETINPPLVPMNFQAGIYGTANIDNLSDLQSRTQVGIKPSREYFNPVDQINDSYMNSLRRFMPADIDQTRNPLNKQMTHPGVIMLGQKESRLAPQSRFKMSSFTENKNQDLLPTKYALNAPFVSNRNIPKIRKPRGAYGTDSSSSGGVGASRGQHSLTKFSGLSTDATLNTLNDTKTRQMPSFTAPFGGKHLACDPTRGVNTTLIMPTSDRVNEQKYTGQPHLRIGNRQHDVDAPDATLRDTLVEATTGFLNANAPVRDDNLWRRSHFDGGVTSRELHTQNVHVGQPVQNIGMGSRTQKIHDWVTNNETLDYCRAGNPTTQIPAHMYYDTVFETSTDTEFETGRVGMTGPSGKSKPPEVGKIDAPHTGVMVVDHTPNPTSFVPVSSTRDTAVQYKMNALEVPGRISSGLGRDGECDRLAFGYSVKENESTGHSSFPRTLTTNQVNVDAGQLTFDTTVLNDRLDLPLPEKKLC
jgi:hypothetical protein